MPNQTMQSSQSSQSNQSQRNTALRTLYQAILSSVDSHEDNPQLLLFIGIELNDVNIVRSCIENYNIDGNRGITGRNQHILEQFGCDFGSPRSVIH
tara:strand:- start:180 stop:467 length:288 start_codon:yes stop_codon:yes gene_type:complete